MAEATSLVIFRGLPPIVATTGSLAASMMMVLRFFGALRPPLQIARSTFAESGMFGRAALPTFRRWASSTDGFCFAPLWGADFLAFDMTGTFIR